MGSLFELLVIALMLALNAVFAAYEMALASVTHVRLLALQGERRRGAAAALHMKGRMEASLAAVQLGLTLCAAVAAAMGGAGVHETLAPALLARMDISPQAAEALAVALIVLPLSAVTIVFGELIPKTLAIRHKESVCLALSPAMRAFVRAAHPAVFLLERAVRAAVALPRRSREGPGHSTLHEMTAAASVARTARLIGAREERIVLSAAQLSYRRVREVMLPAADIAMIPLGAPLAEALARAHLDMHTRFPVCVADGDPQTIKGYVTFKDLVVVLRASPEGGGLESILRPIKRVGERLTLAKALDQLVRERTHIALVEDGDGRVSGLLALEDIIEELVGDIEDEFGRLPDHIYPAGPGWIMGGGVTMKVAASALGLEGLPVEERQTLADWTAAVLGRPVAKGEIVTAHGLRAVVRKLRRRKVMEAWVRKV